MASLNHRYFCDGMTYAAAFIAQVSLLQSALSL